MDGITTHLAYLYGNLTSNNPWEPSEKPDAPILANQILNELERHFSHWRLTSSIAKALEVCAHVIQDTQDAERLVFFAIDFVYHNHEENIHSGDTVE